jgi:CheY-like chemotaxis protein
MLITVESPALAPAALSMTVRSITAPSPARPPTVLVVGNVRDELIAWVEMLREHGFYATGAEGGRAALHKAERAAPDVVVLDFRGRPSSGAAAARQIRERSAGGLVKLLVASTKSPTVLGQYLAEYDAFIARPFEPAQLLRAISGLVVESAVARPRQGRVHD